MILPNSIAGVERIFSVMNYTKCKIINSMETDLLNAMLVVQFDQKWKVLYVVQTTGFSSKGYGNTTSLQELHRDFMFNQLQLLRWGL